MSSNFHFVSPSHYYYFFFFFCSLTHGNEKWFHCKVSTTVCFPTRRIKRSSLHKEDHISHMCERKLRILLCSFFWAVFKMLFWSAEVKAWFVRVMYVNVKVVDLMGFTCTNLEPFRYLFGIHMLHWSNFFPGAEFLVASYICSSFILCFCFVFFFAHFFFFFFAYLPLKLNLLILRIRCLKTKRNKKTTKN